MREFSGYSWCEFSLSSGEREDFFFLFLFFFFLLYYNGNDNDLGRKRGLEMLLCFLL